MPPQRFSRYMLSEGFIADDGAFMLEDAEPFGYIERDDTREHQVRDGDTLFSLAGSHFQSYARAEGLWWVIADFQPDPIIDPTVQLTVGATIYIPSERCLSEEIFNEARRRVVSEV